MVINEKSQIQDVPPFDLMCVHVCLPILMRLKRSMLSYQGRISRHLKRYSGIFFGCSSCFSRDQDDMPNCNTTLCLVLLLHLKLPTTTVTFSNFLVQIQTKRISLTNETLDHDSQKFIRGNSIKGVMNGCIFALEPARAQT